MPGAEAGEAEARAPSAARHRSGSSSRRCRDASAACAAPVSVLERAAHRPLHRVLRPDIALRVLAEAAGEADEAGMLAGAVVVQRARLAAGRGERARRGLVRSANACRIRGSRRRARPSPASRAAVATCAGSPECEAQASAISASRQPVAVGGAALDQRQRLQRLDGRARKDRPLDIAGGRTPPRRRHRPPRPRRDGAIRPSSPRVTSTRTGLSMTPPDAPCASAGLVPRGAGPVKSQAQTARQLP